MPTRRPLSPRAQAIAARIIDDLTQGCDPRMADPIDDAQTKRSSDPTAEAIGRVLAEQVFANLDLFLDAPGSPRAAASLALRCAVNSHDGVTAWPEHLTAMADRLDGTPSSRDAA